MTADLLNLSGPEYKNSDRTGMKWFRAPGDTWLPSLVTMADAEEVRRVLDGETPQCPPWIVDPPYPGSFYIRNGNGRYVAGGRQDVCEALVAKANAAAGVEA